MSENTRQKFGRVFDAAVASDWLITEDGFRTILQIASRTNPQQAVEAYKSEGLDNTQSVKIRNGVAIIPITGPISRYMTWFSYFSGGTSISVLGRDFQAALDDPNVYSIMFEINSPGGEVTGVSEFAQMVYRARSQKPITARVGGLGCSAAYWIAAMCGDIVIDQTAQLGSIGVMAVYMDDRKRLEMNGLSEIEFISSQSPYKNAPPYTDEGRKRIQTRIDAICKVFNAGVGLGRGVSVAKVLSDFGQGDVFVGADAIKAGLADRFGSYEDTIRLLAKTHTPGFVDMTPDPEPFPDDPDPDEPDDDDDDDLEPYGAEKTINSSLAVNFHSNDEAGETAANDSNKTEEPMSEKNNDLNSAAATADTKDPKVEAPKADASAAAAAPAKEAPVAGKDPDTSAAQSEDIATLKTRLEASEKANLESASKIAALEQAATDKWIGDQVGALAGETSANTKILGALVATHGQESDVVAAYIENQKALTAQVKAGGLFKEIGKGGAETDNSAETQLEAKAKEMMAKDPTLTIQQARDTAYTQNPDLYQAMQEGN